MAKAAYPTIGIAAFVMFGIVYFIGCLLCYHPALDETATQFQHTSAQQQYASYLHPNGNAQSLLPQTHCMPMAVPYIRYCLSD